MAKQVVKNNKTIIEKVKEEQIKHPYVTHPFRFVQSVGS